MDSNDSDVDDLADLELSTFNPRRTGIPSDIDRHGDGWYDDKDDDDDVVGSDSGQRLNTNIDVKSCHRTNDASFTTPVAGFDQENNYESIIDGRDIYPIRATTTSTAAKDKHSRPPLNPFSDHVVVDDGDANDDALLCSTGHSTYTTSIDSLSSSAHSIHDGTTQSSNLNMNQQQFSPLNPFVNRSSTNPFAPNWDEEKADYGDRNTSTNTSPSLVGGCDSSTNNSNTEYVYMSRLPEENLGMVLGIDGDQENRKPISSVHVKSITPGGAAARACQGNNRILVGDEIKEIDGRPLNQLTHDECIVLFQEMPCNVVLTISRQQTTGLDLAQPLDQPPRPIKRLKMTERDKSHQENEIFDTLHNDKDVIAKSEELATLAKEAAVSIYHSNLGDIPKGFVAVEVTITKEDNQSLGLSIVPSYGATCDLYQIKRLVPDGACSQSGALQVGDRLLHCNGQNLKGLGQSQCLHVLKSSERVVRLTVLRHGQQQQYQAPVTSERPTSSFLPQADVSVLSGNTDQVVSDNKAVSHSTLDEVETKNPTPTLSDKQQQQNDEDSLKSGVVVSTTQRSEEGVENNTTGVPPLQLYGNDTTNGNPFIVNSTDYNNIPGDFGDDNVFESPKENFDSGDSQIQERPGDGVSGGYSLSIPPPAQFSDCVQSANDPSVNDSDHPGNECVTNIDDLLFLDTSYHHHQQTYQTNQQKPPPDLLISFDEGTTQTQDYQQQNDPLENCPNPRSLEEFAELCFQNISDPYSPNSESPINFENSPVSYNQITPEYQIEQKENPLSLDLITLEECINKNDIYEDDKDQAFIPVSSEPEKFVSTISVTGKDNEPTSPIVESTYGSSQSPPYTTNINIKTSHQDNVSVIDVVPTSPPIKSPVDSPPPSSPPKAYSGSVVFHTYAGSSPNSISSATISLDGDPENQITKMNGTEEKADVSVNASVAHNTLEAATDGQADDIILPMQAVKDEQGRLVCVKKTDLTNSYMVRSLNDSDVNDLAGVMDGFGNIENGALVDSETSSHDVSEEEIVPIKMTRAEKENVLDVLNTWKGSNNNPENGDVQNVLEQAAVRFMNKEPSKLNKDDSDEEEMIKPVAVTKNSHGQSVVVPFERKESEKPLPQKNVSDLVDFLNEHGHTAPKGLERSDSNDSGVEGHVSEEDITPITLSKKEVAIANDVLSQWGNSTPDLASKDATKPNTTGVTHSAKSGDEEDAILPMRHAKDSRGNSLWLPHCNEVTSASQQMKQWDDGAVNDMANFFNSSHVSNDGHVSDEGGVEEETVSAHSISRGEKELVSNVLTKWGSQAPSNKTTEKAGEHRIQNDKKQETRTEIAMDSTDSKPEPVHVTKETKAEMLDEENINTSESVANEDSRVPSKTASQSETTKKVLGKVSVFENKANSQDQVVLRPKNIQNPSNFKAKLEGFEKSSSAVATSDSSRARPRSMFELPSSRNSLSAAKTFTARDSTDKRLSFKPLSSLRPLGSSTALHRDDKSKVSVSSKSSSGLSASLFQSKTPRADYPKTRQEDGSPFQVDVLAGIVGLGLKVKATSSSKFPQVTDVQRNGPLGKSNNVKPGDYLLTVNGTDLAGQTDSRIQQILRLLPRGLVKLVLSTTDSSSSSSSQQQQQQQQEQHQEQPPSSRVYSGGNASITSTTTTVDSGVDERRRTTTAAIISDNEPQTSTDDFGEGSNQVPKSTVTVKSLNSSETFLASSGELELLSSTSKSQDDVITEADFPDDLSSVSAENSNALPVTARIEISPGNSDGTPMKISIKPTPTPRPSSGVPAISSTMSRSLNYASSSINESWETSSQDSTPRESSGLQKMRRISGHDLIASQRNPKGGDVEDKSMVEHDEDIRASSDSIGSSLSKSDNQEKQLKPVEEESLEKSSTSSVNAAPKALSPKVPPPVAPKPRLSTSSLSSIKSDESINSSDCPKSPKSPPPALAPKTKLSSTNSFDSPTSPKSPPPALAPKTKLSSTNSFDSPTSPKSPPPVAPKTRISSTNSIKSEDSGNSINYQKSPSPITPKSRLSSTNSVDSKDKEDPSVSTAKVTKVSAGYERLQAITKAKHSKPSKIIEKSRTNVSSKAKFFESEDENKSDSSKDKQLPSPKPFNSSLLPMSERRKSTGSFPLASSSLTRPTSLLSKGNKESSIPEQTSPTQESPRNVKSPTRMNCALSPRRTSLSEPSSSMVFTFAPKQAPKLSQSNSRQSSTEGKVTSPQKEDVVFHKVTSSSLSKPLSPSLPPSKLESRSSKDTPMFRHGLGRRSNSEASINMPQTLSVSSHEKNEEAMVDTMKMFDDLLQDAPVTHTATDPADILLWAPVRKDRPSLSSKTTDVTTKTEAVQSSNSIVEVKKPMAAPRKSQILNKSEVDTLKPRSKESEGSHSSESPVEELLVLSQTKSKDSYLPPAFPKDDSKQSDLPEELPVQEEMFIPETKSRDSHLPPSLLKTDEVKLEFPEEPSIEEDLIVPELKAKDSHLPPAGLLTNKEKEGATKVADRNTNNEVALDFDSVLRCGKERKSDQNIIANQLAADILKDGSSQSVDKNNQDYELLLKHALKGSVHKTYNIPASKIADSIQKEKFSSNKEINNSENIPAGEIAKDILDKNTDCKENIVNHENIPANEIAKDILDSTSGVNEINVEHNSSVLLDIGGFDKEYNLPTTRLANEIDENEVNGYETSNKKEDDDKYVAQASEIVQSVIAQISSQPEILSRDEKTFNHIEPASPASSEDEPPPLPGAPPPPVIFRTNSEMLADSAWLDNANDVSKNENKEAKETNSVIEEDICESVSVNNNNQAVVTTVKDHVINNEELHQPDISRKLDLSSLDDMEMNLVSQNIANVINKNLSGDDEDLSHTRSDSSEPLNSTGESSFQEADAIRLHSPASVDVLSEDSGMPGDEEFQEVNTDDALSPVSEFSRDNDIPEIKKETVSNVFTSKSSFDDSLKLSPVSDPVQHANNYVNVSDKSPSPPSSPPPTLPSSLPPGVVGTEDFNPPEPNAMSLSISQSSDSQQSLKEVSSPGEVEVEVVEVSEETISVSVNNNESSVNNIINKEDNKQQQLQEQQNISPNHLSDETKNRDGNSVEIESSVTAQSKRKWRLTSNTPKPSLIQEAEADTSVLLDYTAEPLTSSLVHGEFVSLLTKANEVLDSVSAPLDVQLLIIHLHRDGDSADLGIDLKSDSVYKVTKVKKESPLAKEGSVSVDDWLLAVDNLWFPQVSLMRCLARLTKPKHNSLLVIARGQGTPISSSPVCPTESVQPSIVTRPSPSTIERKPENQAMKEAKPTPPPVSPRNKPVPLPEPEVSVPKPTTGDPESPRTSVANQDTCLPSDTPVESGEFNVMMMKGATGVGFCLEGGVGSPKGNVPIIIKRIFKGGPAEKCGQLKVKDEILSVNGMDFTNLRHYEAWNHLKFLDDGEVHFKIRRNEAS